MNRTFASIPSRCILCAWLSLALLFAAAPHPAPAQQLPPLNDPANLAGERVSAPDLADTLSINHGAPALEQLLRKLRTRASFMLIVAHPDDEDGGMLTYLSRGQGARVAMLTLNRGEGGQNLMSADFEDALGLIRTQELLAADRYMGVDQFFGTEVDFGFSKTKEEAFSKWTHERVLYDAVRAVRLYRPLVIASVFMGAPTDGHGQHQVAGEIAQEVFNAAGDPKVFPDQIAEGLPPWQPLKVYARVPFARIGAQGMYDSATGEYAPARFENYVTGKVTDTVPKANVIVPEGTPDALLGGLTYVQFARQGLALQKTQIGRGIRLAPTGRMDVSYHRFGSHVLGPDGKPLPDDGADTGPEQGFYDGIDTSLAGMATLVPEAADKFHPLLEKIDQQIADAQAKFDPSHPETVAPQLRTALGALDGFIKELENPSINDLPPVESYNLLHELRIKRVQLNNALVLALGISLKASAPAPLLVTASSVDVTATLHNSGPFPVTKLDANFAVLPVHINVGDEVSWVGEARFLKPGDSQDYNIKVPFTHGIEATKQYFSRPDIEQPYYDISDPALRNAPATPAPLTATIAVRFGDSANNSGVPLQISAVVAPATGPEGQPLVAVPPVSVKFSRSFGVVRLEDKRPMVWVESTVPISKCLGYSNDEIPSSCSQFADEGKVHLDLPPGWHGESTPTEALEPHGATVTQFDGFTLSPPPLHDGEKLTIPASTLWNGKQYREGFRAVGYPGLVSTNYYTPPAEYRATAVDLHLPDRLAVGYVEGTGDETLDSLFPLLGGHIQRIGIDHLTPDNLKQYDAVVLGVRSYESHADLAAASPALLAYAQAGGIVLVQYVGRNLPADAAPYPLSLGGAEKVVDETAPVQLLVPGDPLLTWPNKITSADFDGWVEERGHGFMADWDPHYTALLETHDPGQQPQRGGLLVAHTGKGAWIYLAYALYRQLPEGVPGPYRLLANLISAGKNPQFLAAAP